MRRNKRDFCTASTYTRSGNSPQVGSAGITIISIVPSERLSRSLPISTTSISSVRYAGQISGIERAATAAWSGVCTREIRVV